MKRYVKNTNFIPTFFVKKLDTVSYEKNNKLILVLLIINLFIIPNSISKILNELKNNEAVPVISVNDTYKNNNKEKIVLLLNSINNTMNSINIHNNIGFIEVDSIEKIYSIEEESRFKIKSVGIKEKVISIEVEL